MVQKAMEPEQVQGAEPGQVGHRVEEVKRHQVQGAAGGLANLLEAANLAWAVARLSPWIFSPDADPNDSP